MILTAHQPQYLPGLRLFDKIARADVFVYLDTVPMESSGYENRNKIKTDQGWQWLTVPVQRKGYQSTPMWMIHIDNTKPWRRKHWKTIQTSYMACNYWSDNADWLADIYLSDDTILSELNFGILLNILGKLDLDHIDIKFARDYKFKGHKSDLVLDMCKKLGATKYIFGAKGRDYAKVEDFEREGIELEFQDYKHPQYNQLHGEFIPNLSIIDLLFNEGPKSLEILVNK